MSIEQTIMETLRDLPVEKKREVLRFAAGIKEQADAIEWLRATTAAERVAWLDSWIESVPRSPALPLSATRRDSLYD